jgi:shikimate kinase
VNKLALGESCSIVYLRATVATLWRRVRRSRHRPLLRTANPKSRLSDILASREQRYQSWADLIVDTDQLSIEGVVDTVMREMNLEEHYADGQCESRQE